VAVTVSEPTGAFEDVHEAVPEVIVALHSVVVPTVNLTDPVGDPMEEMTMAE
jgi:hypothetical protein